MLFYRVAKGDDKIPEGPYNRNTRYDDEDTDHVLSELNIAHCDFAHPTPQLDGIGYIEQEEYCGFIDMDSLRTWFGDWVKDLAAVGFELLVYKVPIDEVRIGGSQAVAAIKSDQLVTRLPLSADTEEIRSNT